jgi:hypothetical protein
MTAHLTRSDCEGSNAMEGTEEGMLWNKSVEDGNVSSECEDDVGTESGDSATYWKR